MGFLSGTKKVVGHIVNFKVTDWINATYHKDVFKYLCNYTKTTFTTEQALRQETFEQAMERLQLTEEDLIARKTEFYRLFVISLLISIALFIYTMFITIKYKNLYGFSLGIGVTILGLVRTFKYHFWLTQINKKKLGLTFKEWIEQ
ncbi:MAG: type IVB secretion system protein IcmV [Gammaproteobacteria bacterium]|jgi:intracellular multiplication protein IcmV